MTTAPPFGTPEYTKWYYDDPDGPGYIPNNPNTINVNPQGQVSVVNTQTGASKVTGSVTNTTPSTYDPSIFYDTQGSKVGMVPITKEIPTGGIVWSSPGSRPDFTQDDPFAGMSSDAIAKSKASFVPSAEKPLPPWVGEKADPEKNVYYDENGKKVTFKTKKEADKFEAKLNELSKTISEKELAKNYIKTPNGWIKKTVYEALQKLDPYKTGGDTLGKQVNPVTGKTRSGQAGEKTQEGYNIHTFILNSKSPGEAFKTLQDAGFSWEDIQQATQYNSQMANDAHKQVLSQYSASGVVKYGGDIAADMIVPGYYTSRHWDELGAGERALSIGIDIISIIPFIGAAGAGARTIATAGRMARLGGAAKGVGRELIAQVRAPVDMIAHPVATVKGTVGTVRDLGETLLHPKKIPEAVLTTSNGTVRLRVSEATTPEEAMKIRDTLMDLAAKGEKPLVEINGTKYELSQSPFMKETGGGLVHATPQGEAFLGGLNVEPKIGMPQTEQGLFMSHEPLPRFAGSSAFGKVTGEKPAFIIVSPETAQKAVQTNKIYAGTAEMERKFPVGSKLPEPQQTLFTRIGPGKTRVEIHLEKPLSKTQILKLKSLGLIEDFKAPFKPAIAVSSDMAGLDSKGVKALVNALDESDNRAVGRVLSRSEDDILRAGERSGQMTGRTTRAATRQGEINRTVPDRIRPASRATNVDRATARRGVDRPANSRVDTSRVDTGRVEASRIDPARVDPARVDPERIEPVRVDPPRIDPPRIDPPRIDPPRIDPPRVNPPRVDPVKFPRLPDGKTETKSTETTIKLEPGSVAWQQGALDVDPSKPGAEPVYKVAEPPDYEVKSTFKKPLGYKGKGKTPQDTIQTIGGPVKRDIDLPLGVTTAHAKPDSEKISFTANRITDNSSRQITERNRMPGRKFPRITPRMGKLR